MDWLKIPDVPHAPVSVVLLSEREKSTVSALCCLGIQTVLLPRAKNIIDSTAYHADILCHYAGEGVFFAAPEAEPIVRSDPYLQKLPDLQCIAVDSPKQPYPQDILLNVLRVGEHLFCHRRVAPALLDYAAKRALRIHIVSQGYAKCSAVAVSETALITADCSIAASAKASGLDVLQITPGFILLEGYPYGFLGGCCGRLSPDCLAFTGDLQNHPDCDKIKVFLKNYGIMPYSLCKGELRDIGGILPVATATIGK